MNNGMRKIVVHIAKMTVGAFLLMIVICSGAIYAQTNESLYIAAPVNTATFVAKDNLNLLGGDTNVLVASSNYSFTVKMPDGNVLESSQNPELMKYLITWYVIRLDHLPQGEYHFQGYPNITLLGKNILYTNADTPASYEKIERETTITFGIMFILWFLGSVWWTLHTRIAKLVVDKVITGYFFSEKVNQLTDSDGNDLNQGSFITWVDNQTDYYAQIDEGNKNCVFVYEFPKDEDQKYAEIDFSKRIFFAK